MSSWNQTQEGANLNQAFANMQSTYNQVMPQHIQSLQNLTNRPITG
jgi:hypothetical protein